MNMRLMVMEVWTQDTETTQLRRSNEQFSAPRECQSVQALIDYASDGRMTYLTILCLNLMNCDNVKRYHT